MRLCTRGAKDRGEKAALLRLFALWPSDGNRLCTTSRQWVRFLCARTHTHAHSHTSDLFRFRLMENDALTCLMKCVVDYFPPTGATRSVLFPTDCVTIEKREKVTGVSSAWVLTDGGLCAELRRRAERRTSSDGDGGGDLPLTAFPAYRFYSNKEVGMSPAWTLQALHLIC